MHKSHHAQNSLRTNPTVHKTHCAPIPPRTDSTVHTIHRAHNSPRTQLTVHTTHRAHRCRWSGRSHRCRSRRWGKERTRTHQCSSHSALPCSHSHTHSGTNPACWHTSHHSHTATAPLHTTWAPLHTTWASLHTTWALDSTAIHNMSYYSPSFIPGLTRIANRTATHNNISLKLHHGDCLPTLQNRFFKVLEHKLRFGPWPCLIQLILNPSSNCFTVKYNILNSLS